MMEETYFGLLVLGVLSLLAIQRGWERQAHKRTLATVRAERDAACQARDFEAWMRDEDARAQERRGERTFGETFSRLMGERTF